MDPSIEIVTPDPGRPFRGLAHGGPGFPCYWHRHAEYELLGITRSSGERRIGDRIDPTEAPQVLLLGPHLPHACVEPGDFEHLVMQFRRDFLGAGFFAIAGAERVLAILDQAGGGLAVTGPAAIPVLRLMRDGIAARGLESVAGLLRSLDAFAAAAPQALAAAPGGAHDDGRLARILDWIDRHADEDIGLDDAASEAGMHPKAFARYFRRASGHSLIGYLAHVRIARACARLRDSDERVTDIALAVGFGTLANFNRQFLRLKRMTPSAYRRRSRGA